MIPMDFRVGSRNDAAQDLSTELCRHISADNSSRIANWEDDELLRRLDRLAQAERESLPEMLGCLAEVARRSLHLERGGATLLEYCVERWKWGEGAAMQRIIASRSAALYPEIYSFLRDGLLNLSTLAPCRDWRRF
jgi:hypothetical protein